MAPPPKLSNYYAYDPITALPIVLAVMVGASWALHIYQSFYYRYWRVTYLIFWGGLVFLTGWMIRAISIHNKSNLGLYATQYILIILASPIYSGAEYLVLGRLMHYLPMHAPFSPSRINYGFIYVGAIVESLSAAGASRLGVAGENEKLMKSGGNLLIAGVILQSLIEMAFIGFVALMHYRCVKAKMLTKNVRSVCIMLYGTSLLILFRCIYRAVEKLTILDVLSSGNACGGRCVTLLRHEWPLYVFEAAPMVLFSVWLNIIHPGRLLPSDTKVFLDEQMQERRGPGWQGRRMRWMTICDIFNITFRPKQTPAEEKFWERPQEWAKMSRDSKTGTDETEQELHQIEEGEPVNVSDA